MKKFIVILFLFSLANANAQTFTELTREAWKKYEQKEYKTSAELYEKAFLSDTINDSGEYYNATCSWALAGNDSMAFVNLNKAITYGFTNVDGLYKDADLTTLRNKAEWKNVLNKIKIKQEQQRKLQEERTPTYYWGMYFGILAAFFFYNLFLFFSLKDVTFLYYSLSMFFLAQLHSLIIPDFGIYAREIFFWLPHVGLGSNTPFLVACIMIVFHLLFVSKFLNLKEFAPRLNKINRWFIIACIVLSVFTLAPTLAFQRALLLFFMVANLFPFVAGIICWRRGHRQAKFLVLAGVFLAICMSIFFVGKLYGNSWVLTFSVFRIDNLAYILFYGLLSFALGDKINNLKEDKLQAQEKALEVLEEKVIERTTEVVKQKEIIEQKNKDITDSITYAKRIQQALLPTEKYIDKSLKRLRKK